MFIDCGQVPSLSNADANAPDTSTVPATVSYTCHPGYNMSGNSTIQCSKSGNWTQVTATCIPLGKIS